MHWRRAIESLDLLAARLVLELAPPVFNPSNNVLAVGRNLYSGRAASIFGRYVGIVRPVFYIVYRSFEEGLADTKDVMGQKPDRAIAIVNRAFAESVIGYLADITLRRAQRGDPLGHQHRGRKRGMSGALQPDKFGDVLQVLAKDV